MTKSRKPDCSNIDIDKLLKSRGQVADCLSGVKSAAHVSVLRCPASVRFHSSLAAPTTIMSWKQRESLFYQVVPEFSGVF
jgi:hypothetical protein